jgi:uncharacterized membrane-anchored protein
LAWSVEFQTKAMEDMRRLDKPVQRQILRYLRERMQQVLAFTEFKQGHRYSDFDSGVDKVAGYGIATLIGGSIAAKAGLFAKLGALRLAFKKVILVGLIAVGAFIAKLFRRRKETAALETPQPPEAGA